MKNWGKIRKATQCPKGCNSTLANGVCDEICNTGGLNITFSKNLSLDSNLLKVSCRFDGGDCKNTKVGTYDDALKFSNQVVSEIYGREGHYYYAHTAGLYDKNFFSRLERQFENEMNQTSFNRVRS